MSAEKSQYWFVRIDDISGVAAILPEFFRDPDWGVILACRETPDESSQNPHYHIALRYKKMLTKQQTNNNLKTRFNNILKGNKDFSNVKWHFDDQEQREKVYRYICKGKAHVCGSDIERETSLNLPDITHKPEFWSHQGILKYHDEYWAQNAKHGRTSGNKSKTDQIISEIIHELSQNPKSKPTREDISRLVIRAVKGKIFDRHAFPIVQAIYYHFHEEVCEQLFVNRLNTMFFPSH